MVRTRTLVGIALAFLLAGCAPKQAKQDASQNAPAAAENRQSQQAQESQQAQSPAQAEQSAPATPPPAPAKAPDKPTSVEPSRIKTTASGLKYADLVVGTGASPQKGQNVTVNYTGWLTNGKKFDSSLDRNQPFSFPIGTGRVIPGWDEGVLSMKVGGKRQLIIPPQLAYGDRDVGNGLIPANSTLIFEVDLLGVQ